MAEAAEERIYKINTTTTKLLIISVDSDPKAELSLSDRRPITWNTIVDALTNAKYCFATRRLPPPPDHNFLNNRPKIRNSRTKIAYLSLQASKKVAFFYSHKLPNDAVSEANYRISYDDVKLMDDLPSYCNLKGLPRFHLFMSLPEDLRLSVVELVDGVVFARLRCVSRQLSRLNWNLSFNILKYSHPNLNKRRVVQQVEELKEDDNGGGNSCFLRHFLIRFASAVCFVAVVYSIVNDRSGVFVYEFDQIGDDEDEERMRPRSDYELKISQIVLFYVKA
ncbi:hypothetical protein BUALT_Bualt05G0041600 [Buddleja alternifolia]|uniref:F-box domain-containing protein n=1 Tax=Buddleja alternifolia TaxID=168488 RepID=A0AAV6XSK5_9LAMI|nr:hypothetical protein BUALT_Bualt05G0041600 [Buddleja alternifolia]